MGKFDDLTPRQSDFLIRLVAAGRENKCSIYWLAVSSGISDLLGMDTENGDFTLQGVPSEDVFYWGLAQKGYLDVKDNRSGNLQVSVTRQSEDYADYAQKSRLGRWAADLDYDLGSGNSLRSKLIWAVLTLILSVLTTIALSRMGVL